MAAVYDGRALRAQRLIGRVEKLLYRVAGVDGEDMTWKAYCRAVLAFNGVGMLFLFALQRSQGMLPLNEATPNDATIELPGLQVDLARYEVRVDGREVRLTPIEFKILVLLARNAGKVLTHCQILNEIWGPGHAGENHNVRVHVALLRKKLEPDPMHPRRLMTETGVGYRLRDRETD